MKIGILIKNIQAGGAQKQSILLAGVLKTDFQVLFVVFNANTINPIFHSQIVSMGINFQYLKGSFIQRLADFWRICRREKIDLIFSYLAGDNFIAGILGKLAGVKYVIGGIRNSEISPWKLRAQRILTRYILDYIVFNNASGMQNLLHKNFTEKKCRLIDNAILLDQQPIIRNDKKEIVIITVGRFEVQKDLLTAIKSIFYVIEQHQLQSGISIKYFIVGKGSLYNRILTWIRDYRLESIVQVILEPPDINTYLCKSDIYLSTSVFEGISNSIMEAMLFSLPIVATNVGDNNRLVENHVNGFLVPVGDHISVAEKLSYLIHHQKHRIDFGSNSYSLIKDKFSVERFGKEYKNLITEIVNKNTTREMPR